MSLEKNMNFVITILLLFLGCSNKSSDFSDDNDIDNVELQLSDFSSAEACQGCHPNHYNEWKGSMHAYAFVDPINTAWMNSLRESVGEAELGQACVQCHSPIGMLTGETPIGFDKADVDPKVKEGINCDVCHLMERPSPTAIGEAIYHYDVKSGKQYGSIMDPVSNDFHLSEGKTFYSNSSACLPCHDFINNQGVLAEITYTEWLESPYSAMSSECQDCHMETYSGEAAVGAPQRDNLHRHDFIGVDIALIDDFPNKAEQKEKIEQLLKNSVTLVVEIPDSIQTDSTLKIKATVINDKTGHDIPSSVTFVREMWLEVIVINGVDTLYKSGCDFDTNSDLISDKDLVMFQSALFKNGEPANVFTADSIKIGSIAPFESKTALYSVPVSTNLGNSLEVRVRLRFRTFPPSAIPPGYIDTNKIPIFEMEKFEGVIVVHQ